MRRKPIAMGADRAGEDEREAVGAILELVQRLRVRGGRVGMVDALHERLPGRARCAPATGCAPALRAVSGSMARPS